MNNESPLVPQGSFLEQKNRSRARVRIAVFVVLAIHGIGVLALLMQGCKPSSPTSDTATNAAPVFEQTTNPPVVHDTNWPSPTDTNAATSAMPPPITATPPPLVSPSTATDYKIQKGDTFATVAKKFQVSVKALTDANPGLEPTRLQIGQTIHVPPSSTSTAAAPAPTTAGTTGSEQTYTVKSGDSLTKIAAQFGITVKAIRSANDLKTDRIRVGQKLKIPAKANGAAPSPADGSATSAPAATAPTQ